MVLRSVVIIAVVAWSGLVNASETAQVKGLDSVFKNGASLQWKGSDDWLAEPVIWDGNNGYKFKCDFSKVNPREKVPRCSWDMILEGDNVLDLSKSKNATVYVSVKNAAPIQKITLFFKSGTGWYYHEFNVREGENRIVVPVAKMPKLGTPAGLESIDTVRVSVWKKSEGESVVNIRVAAPAESEVRTTLESAFSKEHTPWTAPPKQGGPAEFIRSDKGPGYKFPSDFPADPIIGLDDANGYVFKCDFSKATAKDPRCSWDAKFDGRDVLDLSKTKSVTLQVTVKNVAPIQKITLFFRSGAGWYYYESANVKEGDNKLVLPVAKMGKLGTPAGLEGIDTIRFSVWKKSEGESVVRLSLVGITADAATLPEPQAQKTPETAQRKSLDSVFKAGSSLQWQGADGSQKSAARCYWDLENVDIDLSKAKHLSLWVNIEGADYVKLMYVYLRSEGVWFGWLLPVRDGWNRIITNVSAIKPDGKPKGGKPPVMQKVDCIRISPYKRAPGIVNVTICGADAREDEVVLYKQAWHSKTYSEVVEKTLPKQPQPLELKSYPPEPELFTVGKPVKVVWQEGKMKLPGGLDFSEKDVKIDDGVKALIGRSVCASGKDRLAVKCGLWPKDYAPEGLSAAEQKLMLSDEAFKLEIRPSDVQVTGRSRDAVLRGLATLAMLGSKAKYQESPSLRCMTLHDAPRLQYRSWWIGPSTSSDTFREMADQMDVLYLLRYNSVAFMACSYGGYAPFPFESHTNIGFTVDMKRKPGGSMSKREWSDLADYARARGLRPVPIFYSWSRAGFILNKPEYRHLAENPDGKAGRRSGLYCDRNFCSANPESYKLLFDLYGELIDTMKLTDLNIGHDEVHFDDLVFCPVCKKQHRTPMDWYVETVTRTNEFLRKKGVNLWIFADNLTLFHNGGAVGFKPSDLKRLPKDVILIDWEYGVGPYPALKEFTDAGFKTTGGPWYDAENAADMVSGIVKAGCYGFSGLVNGGTYPGTIAPEMVSNLGLGAYLSWSPENCNLTEFPGSPSRFFQAAAYRCGKELPRATGSRPVMPKENLTAGQALTTALGFPSNSVLSFLRSPLTSLRGAKLDVFEKNGEPAGLVVKAKGTAVRLPLSGRAKYLTLLHTTSRQDFDGGMPQMITKYRDSVPGKITKYKDCVPGRYILHYADNTKAELPLQFRGNINDWNARLPSRWTEPGLFGVAGGKYHVNIPVLTWSNPSPEKELKELEIAPGDREGMDLILLALTLD
jgi:hypothetical protein